VSIIRY